MYVLHVLAPWMGALRGIRMCITYEGHPSGIGIPMLLFLVTTRRVYIT